MVGYSIDKANHTIYTKDGRSEAVPRHNEINERLARNKIRELGLK